MEGGLYPYSFSPSKEHLSVFLFLTLEVFLFTLLARGAGNPMRSELLSLISYEKLR
jgi:hypothetical protein